MEKPLPYEAPSDSNHEPFAALMRSKDPPQMPKDPILQFLDSHDPKGDGVSGKALSGFEITHGKGAGNTKKKGVAFNSSSASQGVNQRTRSDPSGNDFLPDEGPMTGRMAGLSTSSRSHMASSYSTMAKTPVERLVEHQATGQKQRGIVRDGIFVPSEMIDATTRQMAAAPTPRQPPLLEEPSDAPPDFRKQTSGAAANGNTSKYSSSDFPAFEGQDRGPGHSQGGGTPGGQGIAVSTIMKRRQDRQRAAAFAQHIPTASAASTPTQSNATKGQHHASTHTEPIIPVRHTKQSFTKMLKVQQPHHEEFEEMRIKEEEKEIYGEHYEDFSISRREKQLEREKEQYEVISRASSPLARAPSGPIATWTTPRGGRMTKLPYHEEFKGKQGSVASANERRYTDYVQRKGEELAASPSRSMTMGTQSASPVRTGSMMMPPPDGRRMVRDSSAGRSVGSRASPSSSRSPPRRRYPSAQQSLPTRESDMVITRGSLSRHYAPPQRIRVTSAGLRKPYYPSQPEEKPDWVNPLDTAASQTDNSYIGDKLRKHEEWRRQHLGKEPNPQPGPRTHEELYDEAKRERDLQVMAQRRAEQQEAERRQLLEEEQRLLEEEAFLRLQQQQRDEELAQQERERQVREEALRREQEDAERQKRVASIPTPRRPTNSSAVFSSANTGEETTVTTPGGTRRRRRDRADLLDQAESRSASEMDDGTKLRHEKIKEHLSDHSKQQQQYLRQEHDRLLEESQRREDLMRKDMEEKRRRDEERRVAELQALQSELSKSATVEVVAAQRAESEKQNDAVRGQLSQLAKQQEDLNNTVQLLGAAIESQHRLQQESEVQKKKEEEQWRQQLLQQQEQALVTAAQASQQRSRSPSGGKRSKSSGDKQGTITTGSRVRRTQSDTSCSTTASKDAATATIEHTASQTEFDKPPQQLSSVPDPALLNHYQGGGQSGTTNHQNFYPHEEQQQQLVKNTIRPHDWLRMNAGVDPLTSEEQSSVNAFYKYRDQYMLSRKKRGTAGAPHSSLLGDGSVRNTSVLTNTTSEQYLNSTNRTSLFGGNGGGSFLPAGTDSVLFLDSGSAHTAAALSSPQRRRFDLKPGTGLTSPPKRNQDEVLDAEAAIARASAAYLYNASSDHSMKREEMLSPIQHQGGAPDHSFSSSFQTPRGLNRTAGGMTPHAQKHLAGGSGGGSTLSLNQRRSDTTLLHAGTAPGDAPSGLTPKQQLAEKLRANAATFNGGHHPPQATAADWRPLGAEAAIRGGHPEFI